MSRRPLVPVLLLLFEYIAAERVLSGLDLIDVPLVITANCCPLDGSNQPCIEEQCPVADTQPGNITDGNTLTEWMVNFLSNGSNGATPTAIFTLTFGQSYMFQSVTLLSTTRFLPRMWSLTTGSGSTTEYSNDGVFEQSAVLEGDETLPPTSSLQLSVGLPTSGDPISIAELVITIGGFGLPEELGCGVCLEPLNSTLDGLLVTLENVSLVSRVNQTHIQLLEQDIAEIELDVSGYEDSLLVLAVVLGSNLPLDDNVTLSNAVSRVDLELIPPIPNKLERLRELVDLASSVEFDFDFFRTLLEEVESELGTILTSHMDLVNTFGEYGANFTRLLDRLKEDLNSNLEIQKEVLQILGFVLNTNFSRELEDLLQYESMVERARNASLELYDVIMLTVKQAMDTNVSLESIDSLLQKALDIIGEVNSQSNTTLRTVNLVDGILGQIETLQLEIVLLDGFVNSSIVVIRDRLNRSLLLIQEVNASLQLTGGLVADLSLRVSQLSGEVNEFSLLLSPYRLPPSCNLSLPCTNNEVHAMMLYLNASEIVNSSLTIYTLRRVRILLMSIDERGELFDYSLINEIAIRALSIAQDARDRVFASVVSDLLNQVADDIVRIRSLREQSARLADATNRSLPRLDSLLRQFSELAEQFEELDQNRDLVRNLTTSLRSSTGLNEEAGELLLQAQEARNVTMETDTRVAAIGVGPIGVEFDDISSAIVQTREMSREAKETLDEAEEKFGIISTFLNSTRDGVVEFVLNNTAFISENERLIGEINAIISGLADIHNRLNEINSPVQLVSKDGKMPYLSLQPPPGRTINDSIQFESMDLYFWTDSGFRLPSMLFYAGPIYHEERDAIESAVGVNEEDYFLLTVEVGNIVQLQWSLGGVVGMVTNPGFRTGVSQIVVTRHGSLFQLQYGVTNEPGVGTLGGSLTNGSVLFRVSPRTAFLLGGWPEGAQLGVPSSIVRLSDYNTLQGQVQLFLFNGRQWGLWNIRGASSTDLIGSFQSNFLANTNIEPSSISFDGSGYLFVSNFSDIQYPSGIRRMTIVTRQNDERDCLVLYAYDESIGLSMEVAFTNGNLRLIIHRHDLNLTLVDYTAIKTNDMDELPPKSIILAFSGGRFLVNFRMFAEHVSDGIFFADLTLVKAWFGGIRRDSFQSGSSYVPQVSNSSYHGCMSIQASIGGTDTSFLRGQHFFSSFLNSSIQKGFSGSCLKSIYAAEVGFDGGPEAFLSYKYLSLNFPNNHPTTGEVTGSWVDGAAVISFLFLTQRMEGVLLAAVAMEESSVAVVLSDGNIRVQIHDMNGGSYILTSSERVEVGTWQKFLLELRSDAFNLYHNGILQDSQASSLAFIFELVTTQSSSNDNIIFIGGSSASIAVPGIPVNISSFVGCMRNLVFNYNAMGFLNSALPEDRRAPAGVSYNTCPFFNMVPDPVLAVLQETPQERVCLVSTPLRLQGTHGGFHRETSLITSNVIGLFARSWTISLSLRQMGDGHVMSIGSTEGHMIRLLVRNGSAVMTLHVEGTSEQASGGILDEGVFMAMDINCQVDSVQKKLSCLLSVAGQPSGDRLQVPYTVSTFFPSLHIVFGKTDEMQSFVGCIRDLAIDGKSDGFSGVQTDVECFIKTQSGLGFSGLSRISTLLSGISAAANASHTVTVEFQTHLENGLLLMLSNSIDSSPVLAVGMFNRQLRIADLSTGKTDTHTPLGIVCDPASPSRFTFTLTYGSTFVEAAIISVVEGSSPIIVQLPFSPGEEQLLLSIGNSPRDLVVPKELGLFRFLLGNERLVDSLPPGLVGCVTDVRVDGLALLEAAFEDVLDGFCPSS